MDNPFEAAFARTSATTPREAYGAGIAEGVALAKTAIQNALGKDAYPAIHPQLSETLIAVVLTAAAFANEDLGAALTAKHLTPKKPES